LRRKHKYEIITTMKDDTQRKKIQQLVDMTKFTQAEVETLYKKFHSSIKVEDNNLMSFNIFKSLFPQIFPFWKHFTESSLPQLLFKIFDVNNDAHLDVKEFVVGMCKVYKGTLKERFLCMFWGYFRSFSMDLSNFVLLWSTIFNIAVCFQVFDTSSNHAVGKDQLIQIVTLFTAYYQPYNPQGIIFERPESKIRSFVDRIYTELGVSSSEQLSLEQILATAIETNMIAEYFNLDQDEKSQPRLSDIISSFVK
jgi:hypothetical protein